MLPSERLKMLRRHRGYPSAAAAARASGIQIPTFTSHENGHRKLNRASAEKYAAFLGTSPEWLLYGHGPNPISDSANSEQRENKAEPRAAHRARRSAAMRPTLSGESKPLHQQAPQTVTRLPVFGFTMPTIPPDGRVILTERPIAETWCPEPLRGVFGAYALYVYSSSMSPRYEPGEMVWVHPRLPIVQGDYVVVQVRPDFVDDILYQSTDNLYHVADEQNSRIGWVRRFVSQTTQEIILERLDSELSQDRTISFPANIVLALHKVVFSGQG